LKTAKELVREIGLAVQPPQGVAIMLTEQPGVLPNWVAAAEIMEPSLTVKFSDKVAELRNTGDMDQGPGECGVFIWPNSASVNSPIEHIGQT
jgi:hypothetical protein